MTEAAEQESIVAFLQQSIIKRTLEGIQTLSSDVVHLSEAHLQQSLSRLNLRQSDKALFLQWTWTKDQLECTWLGNQPPRRPESAYRDSAIVGCMIVYILRSFTCIPLSSDLSLDLQASVHIWYASCTTHDPTCRIVSHHQGDTSVMRSGACVLFKLPSENTRCVFIQPSAMMNLGKFGSFQALLLVDRPYSCYYHIASATELMTVENMDSQDVLDAFQFNPSIETDANNQHIVDDQSSQKLTIQEIQEMREKNIKGEMDAGAVIKKIVENSVTFDQKTEFAKAKYIKRKVKKFTRVVQPLYPTALNLCDYYLGKCPQKIRELRIDTLTQMMTLANVHAGGKYLIVDDISGLLVGAVMERMGGYGSIVGVHHDSQPTYDILKYMNFSAWESSVLTTCAYNKLGKAVEQDESKNVEASSAETAEVRRLRLHHRLYKLRNTHQLMEAKDFDGLLIASEFNVTPLLCRLVPYLKGSATCVVYHPFKEPLLQPFLHMRESPEFTFAQLSESWMREYQVPIKSLSGTHPRMTTSSTGGFLLSAVRVRHDPTLVLDLRHKKGKKPRN